MPSKEHKAILQRADDIGHSEGDVAIDQNNILLGIFFPSSKEDFFFASTTTHGLMKYLFTFIVYYTTVIPINNSF